MRHAWEAYRKYAWGYDQLQTLSKTPSTWFGLGLTIVDSIDTLYIMNMEKGLIKTFFFLCFLLSSLF
jgi:mannosyl-oligosaccharide alpha-1,2-mannosidase